jgi:hypothetical protein
MVRPLPVLLNFHFEHLSCFTLTPVVLAVARGNLNFIVVSIFCLVNLCVLTAKKKAQYTEWTTMGHWVTSYCLVKPGSFVCYEYANVTGTRTLSLCDPFCIPQEGCKSPLLWPCVNRTERGDESPLSYGVKSATYPMHCFVEGCPNTESFLLVWGNNVTKLMYASVQTNYSAKMRAFWDTASVVSLK